MKILASKFTLLLSISLALFSCSQDDSELFIEEASKNVSIKIDVDYSSMEDQIIELVNAHRNANNLSKLSISNIASGVADGHSNYMITKDVISHDNFNERANYLTEFDNAKSVGENVAFGYGTAEGVMNGWLNSTGHREVIENSKYTHVGISSIANSQNRNYFTLILLKK